MMFVERNGHFIDSLRMKSLFAACLWITNLSIIGCSPSPNQGIELDDDVYLISVDVSKNNPEKKFETSGFFLGRTSIKATEDPSISRERLDSLLQEVHVTQPAIVTELPTSSNWVFYIAHNGKSETEVKLRLIGDKELRLDGKVPAEPLKLPAGAHGFRVDTSTNPIQIEHVFVPPE